MKKSIFIIALSVLCLSSCNEDKFLNETPIDFMSGDNSYMTQADFDAATTELYYLTRKEFFCNGDRSQDYLFGTDMIQGTSPQSNIATDQNPTGDIAKVHWNNLYLLISQANVIISRIQQSPIDDAQKVLFEAKARFFRGFAYRTLTYLYGGVPLQLEEVTSPKTDYTRAGKEQTLQQALDDMNFAAEHLPDIKDVKDGEINAPAAWTLVAELQLALGHAQEAVDAASKVIQNPALALMQNRFGRRSGQPGDVYWDLFQRGNQNRSAGNTESLWVIQLNNPDVPGGGSSTNTYFWTVPGNFLAERYFSPQVGLFKFIMPDGSQLSPFIWPTGDYSGGRGIGSGIADEHFYTDVWQSDWSNDIRNSNYNFVRKIKYNNPNFVAKYGSVFGDSIDLMNPVIPAGVTMLTGVQNQSTLPGRYLTGYQSKCTTPFDHPDGLYLNKSTYLLAGTGGGTYSDQYMLRLPEAYLLRAEAYFRLGQAQKAADDLNVIRRRAHASDVTASQVSVDYILDERMREYGIEEKRRLTLSRMGELGNRVRKYNPWYGASHSADGKEFKDGYALYPIPQTAIEANKDAVLEQNLDY